MKNEIEILKKWLDSTDDSLERLWQIKNICLQIADADAVAVAYYAAVAVADAAAVSAAEAAYDAVSAADARKKVQKLVDVLERNTNNTNNNNNAEKISELSKEELIETFGNVPINKLDFTLNELRKALK